MFRSRFLWKVFACAGLPVLLMGVIAAVLVPGSVARHELESVQASLASKAFLARETFLPALRGQETGTEEKARRLSAQTGCRYTVVRADGMVLAESDREPVVMENHAQRPEIVAARADAVGTSMRESRTTRVRTVYAALAVEEGGKRLGWVRVALTASAAEEATASARRWIALGTLAGLVLAFVASLFVARGVTRTLSETTMVADAVSEGDTAKRVPVAGDDEFAVLARAFNRMADDLALRLEMITRDRKELQAIVEGMVEGVVAVDREERVVLMTGVARRLLGVSTGESVGRKLWEITRLPDVVESLGASVREGRSLRDELKLPKSPRDQVIEYQVAPIHGGANGWTGAVLVLHDVSELRRADQVRRDFVANVSHELKTPLTAIKGSVETVLDDPAMDKDQARRFLTMIRDHTGRLTALVTDLLALSRIEAEEAAFKSRPIELRDPVMESVRRLDPMASSRGIRLSTELGDGPTVVLGDREALIEIADNLVTNAIQYTKPGGRVVVRIRSDADAVLLDVEDTGIGIEAVHLDRIFERFYRVDKARSREMGGTGLGLSIVKHLVQAMHGSVSVISRPGSGSTFTVRLRPAAEAAA